VRLSDTIEAFIKALMQEEDQSCELKRNELAEYFHCAPSQINYVLSTRFTPDHGYIISSQRGGGGCIRIVRLRETARDRLTYLVNERIGESIDETSAQILCSQLAENQFIPLEEARLMAAAVSRQALSLPVPEEIKNMMRARILKSMLTVVAQRAK
jgi:transcriptional regulator CtsR